MDNLFLKKEREKLLIQNKEKTKRKTVCMIDRTVVQNTVTNLEFLQLSFGNSVSFGDDWYDIYFGIQLFHAHQVNGLQSSNKQNRH